MKTLVTKVLSLLLLLSLPFWGNAQMSKGTKKNVAITNATIVTVTNGIIENGTVLIGDGKILEVGTSVTIPPDIETIDGSGKFVYPGMIDAGTQLGLVEVGSLPETRDYSEIGDVTPHVKALTAVNPNSVSIPVTRVSGVTTAFTLPSGGTFPGTGALINLHGYSPAQMYAGFQGIIINFPNTGKRNRSDDRSEEDIKKENEKALKNLNDIWDKAILYARIEDAYKTNPGQNPKPEYYPEMQALSPLVRGEMYTMINVDRAKDIEAAIKWVGDREISKVIFMGCKEGWRVAGQIAKAGIPVITGPVLDLPSRRSDRYDKAYANAGTMQKAGVTVALRTMEASNVRNLPFHAGFAAAYGMGKEEALKAVTIVPARLFGVDDKYGSIEKGKNANLFVADGDPFETKTQITHVFIDGWQMPVDSRHIRLYNEFLEREPGVSK